MKVKWKAKKNTERTAIQKFGDIWDVMQRTASGSSILIRPSSVNNDDWRWINNDQIVKEIE